jgi:DNA invertase Pin-like site-specific DNA recombinase
MSIYTYARVSTNDQNVAQQLQKLSKYNPDYEVSEIFTGTTTDRPNSINCYLTLKKEIR